MINNKELGYYFFEHFFSGRAAAGIAGKILAVAQYGGVK